MRRVSSAALLMVITCALASPTPCFAKEHIDSITPLRVFYFILGREYQSAYGDYWVDDEGYLWLGGDSASGATWVFSVGALKHLGSAALDKARVYLYIRYYLQTENSSSMAKVFVNGVEVGAFEPDPQRITIEWIEMSHYDETNYVPYEIPKDIVEPTIEVSVEVPPNTVYVVEKLGVGVLVNPQEVGWWRAHTEVVLAILLADATVPILLAICYKEKVIRSLVGRSS